MPEKYTKGIYASLAVELSTVIGFLQDKPGMGRRALTKLESERVRILQPSTTNFWLMESLGLSGAEKIGIQNGRGVFFNVITYRGARSLIP